MNSRLSQRFTDVLNNTLESKILHFQVFGQSMVVINDLKIAQDLLDKRSAVYSSRYELLHEVSNAYS